MKDEIVGSTAQRQAEDPQSATRRRKVRKSRSKGLRSKKGCSTCRARHMKCDESLPACGGCLKAGRDCVYGESNDSTGHQHDTMADRQHHNPQTRQGSVASVMSYKRPRRESEPRTYDVLEIPLSGIFRDPRVTMGSLFDSNGPAILSPRSDSSTSSRNPSNATSRWFGLLASDVSSANQTFASPLMATRQLESSRNHSTSPIFPPSAYPPDTPQDHRGSSCGPTRTVDRAQTGEPRLKPAKNVPEAEAILFRHYIEHVSAWLDLNDPYRHFSILVPRLAKADPGLMKAILALSARDLTLKPVERSPKFRPDRNTAVEYYHQTLQHLQVAMKNPDYLGSDELLATILIISFYELIDGAGQAWERHLRGAFGALQSFEIHGESGGFKQAVWWAWLRQDLWAGYIERRRIYSCFVPTRPRSTLNEWGLAERSVYLCTHCVNFASQEEIDLGQKNLEKRIRWAEQLEKELDDWLQHLPPHYQPLPLSDKPSEGVFQPIFIHPPAFAAAVQLYHFGQILLQTSRPSVGGFKEVLDKERRLNAAIDGICGIALTMYDDAASIMSSGCTFVAGLHTKHVEKRKVIIEILGELKDRTGFPLNDFRDELHEQWAKTTPR